MTDDLLTTVKACCRCGETKPVEAFCTGYGVPRGFCRACNAIAHKARYERIKHTEEYKRWQRQKQLRRYHANRERHLARLHERVYQPSDTSSPKAVARYTLRNAVASGQMSKPDKCESCGVVARIHGHHDDYAKPSTFGGYAPCATGLCIVK